MRRVSHLPKAMRTSTLLLILSFVVLILLTFPEESHEVVFVLTHGRVSNKHRKKLDRKNADRKKRKRNRARKNKNRKERRQERRKLKELKRWLARFSKKVRNAVPCVDIGFTI